MKTLKEQEAFINKYYKLSKEKYACEDGLERIKGCKTFEEVNEKLTVGDVSFLLENFPELIDYLDCSKMKGGDISVLLIYQPQLINHKKIDCSKMNGWHIHWVLSKQPQLIDHEKIDCSKMSGKYIRWVLRYQPQLREKLDKYLK